MGTTHGSPGAHLRLASYSRWPASCVSGTVKVLGLGTHCRFGSSTQMRPVSELVCIQVAVIRMTACHRQAYMVTDLLRINDIHVCIYACICVYIPCSLGAQATVLQPESVPRCVQVAAVMGGYGDVYARGSY